MANLFLESTALCARAKPIFHELPNTESILVVKGQHINLSAEDIVVQVKPAKAAAAKWFLDQNNNHGTVSFQRKVSTS